MTSAPGVREPLLPKDDARPPFFAYAVSLYRADLLFRSLVDLTVAGLVILGFMGGFAAVFAPVKTAVGAAVMELQRPVSDVRNGAPALFAARNSGPGQETILAIKPPRIPQGVIDRAPPRSVAALQEANRHLVAEEAELALHVLPAADGEPALAFAGAVVTLHLAGAGRGIEAQRLLRTATAKAFAPAFTLNGLVLLRILQKSERGELPDSERVSLDGAGRAVPVTNAQLAAETVLWWQRGAAFHDPEAMRLLGMAEARGFNGKRNLPAAIAYWRDAAARGDALARFELAQLYFEGIGVEADSEKAYELFRQAADQGVLRAGLALGAALMAKSITGDVEATGEALRMLDAVARKSDSAEERTLAHFAIGTFLFEAAPATLRDPKRALEHFRMARRYYPQAMRPLYFPQAIQSLARAFETGVGTERDLVKAVGYLGLIRANDLRAEADHARLIKALSPEERDRAARFRLADDPASAAFENVYPMITNAPFKAIRTF
jgi:TPR repeat protein